MSAVAVLVAMAAAGQFGERSPSPYEAPEGYRWNFVSVRAAHAYHNLDEREAVDLGAPADEHLGGFVLAYQRSLIPGLFGIGISNAYMFNADRFDIPIDILLVVMQQFGDWRPYLSLGPTMSLRWYHADRAAQEGVDFEFTLGFAGGVGVIWQFKERWGLLIEVHGSFIPNSDVVEAELNDSLGFIYRF